MLKTSKNLCLILPLPGKPFIVLGHPIVGDKKYGAQSNPIQRMALHAQVLAFTHPTTGKELRFESPIPERFLQISAQGKQGEPER